MLRPFLMLLLLGASPRGAGQYFATYDPNKEVFSRQVRLIDEFIERFNNDPTTAIRREYAGNKQYKVTRSRLLVSLFDLENASFTKDTSLNGFFRQVLNPAHPVYLSFNDTGWYAAAQGVFLYKGRMVEIPLVLRVMSHGDEWSKWVIAGIGNPVAANEPMPSISVSDKGMAPAYISTSAYATNFVELHYIFTRNMAAENFFDAPLLATPKCREFIRSVSNGGLQFLYVKSIAFHFFQVKGWAFTVQEFRRKTLNSGWLISNIHPATDAEKAVERKALLGL